MTELCNIKKEIYLYGFLFKINLLYSFILLLSFLFSLLSAPHDFEFVCSFFIQIKNLSYSKIMIPFFTIYLEQVLPYNILFLISSFKTLNQFINFCSKKMRLRISTHYHSASYYQYDKICAKMPNKTGPAVLPQKKLVLITLIITFNQFK